MWVMKYKDWMHDVGIGTALSPGFDVTLPATEATILDLTKASDKEQSVAKTTNAKAVNGCVLVFETAEMMNKIIKEQAHGTDWPGGKFTRLCKRIQLDEKPDDDMAKFELDGELRRITLSRKKDPKDLLAEILAVEIKFGITCTDKKKCPSFFVPERGTMPK